MYIFKGGIVHLPLYSLTSGKLFSSPESLENDISRTICISGHRERSIVPYKNNPVYRELTIQTVKCLLARYLDIAYANGYDTFISGMAVGADLWSAEHIVRRKRQGMDIKLIGAVPYMHHADCFPKRYIDLLWLAEKYSDKLVLVSQNPDIEYSSRPLNPNQSSSLYRDRNYFMVDNSSAIIAFFNDGNYCSGTAQTVNYAMKKNLNICKFGLDTVYKLIEKYGDINRIKSAIKNIT